MSSHIVQSLAGRDFLALSGMTAAEFSGLLESSLKLKQDWQRSERPQPLAGSSLAMIFEKQSLRTRSTFDIAMAQLGGHSVLLGQDSIGLGVRESARDIATNLSRWTAGIMARTNAHQTVTDLARFADVPVINGLTDLQHPTQAVADYLTLLEQFGSLDGLRVVYVGDGNNVANSHIEAAALTGISLVIACPEGFDPDPAVMAWAADQGADVSIERDPRAAARGADALYTDVWISMGQEAEGERRRKAFAGYTITPDWFDDLSSRGVFMHDLPAHYGEECTEEAVYHERSVVFDQAENRLHAHKGILLNHLVPL